MTGKTAPETLLAAVNQYLEMMYDGDLSRFDTVFAPTAQLHGVNDGQLRVLPAADYRRLLSSRPSPKSKSAPRQQDILLVDIASPSQALVKVRVRIDDVLFVDYLSYHLIDGAWLVTAKSFHIERRFEATST
ncbi:MAG: nuclear transport factor 2 family protein [Xanthobacteraceae bacterium]|nr:nuclear transport factor 2 family protein [Xanthobacteraceae bacterium]